MSEPARITFAIPYYRGLGWLREAIESVRAQRETAWHCLILDDGAEPDGGAGELVRALADPRFRYLANPATLGMVANWNQGIDAVKTDLVTLLHADDRLTQDYADVVLALAAAHPRAVAVCCGARIIDAAGRKRFSLADAFKRLLVPRGEPWRLRGERGLHALLRGDFVMCPTLCWRRSRLGARRFEAGWRQVQDLELLTRLLLEGEEIVGTRRVGYEYRRHDESATALQSESLLRFEEEIALYNRLAESAESLGWTEAARVARRRTIVRLHLSFRIASDLTSGRVGPAWRKLRFLLGGAQGPGGRTP